MAVGKIHIYSTYIEIVSHQFLGLHLVTCQRIHYCNGKVIISSLNAEVLNHLNVSPRVNSNGEIPRFVVQFSCMQMM
jgi:hypothetical protein